MTENRAGTETGEERLQKAGGILLTVFLCVLIPVLSFYAPEGYQELGNQKFTAWRVIAVVFALPLLVITAIRWVRTPRPGQTAGKDDPGRNAFRPADLFAILYGVFLTASFFLSYDRAESLWGTTGWRMGFLTELLFLLYYMFARIYPIRFRIVVPIAVLSGGGVLLTAVLERAGIFLFSYQMPDEVFVSTIGNVDWYCGYLAVVISLAVALCLGSRAGERICGGILFAAGACSAVILGANTGILLLVSCLPAMLLVLGDTKRIRRLLQAIAILAFLLFIVSYLGMLLAFHPAVWLPDLWYRFFTAGFGNGRGAIWRYAYEMLDHLPVWRLFVGVGPDAFAVYSYQDPQLLRTLTEYFGMARLTNAHSELLTLILDEGILAAAAYLLFILSALMRIIRKNSEAKGTDPTNTLTVVAIFAIVSVSVVQAVTFRTISATPFLFLLIGAAIREEENKPVSTGAPSGQDPTERKNDEES